MYKNKMFVFSAAALAITVASIISFNAASASKRIDSATLHASEILSESEEILIGYSREFQEITISNNRKNLEEIRKIKSEIYNLRKSGKREVALAYIDACENLLKSQIDLEITQLELSINQESFDYGMAHNLDVREGIKKRGHIWERLEQILKTHEMNLNSLEAARKMAEQDLGKNLIISDEVMNKAKGRLPARLTTRSSRQSTAARYFAA